MDKRRDAISTLKICRFCLTQDVPMACLYDKKRKVKNAVTLPLKILASVSVEVFPSDKMPNYICERCKYFMNICFDFKQICRQADEAILHYVQDNKPFKPIGWPISLNDAYRESNDIGVVKTVVEGGTTVQVTHDMSDSEDEDEENVYNVKISDGSEEVSKTCVKVVASRDNEEKLEGKGPGERCWACDECNCTYPLQQMLELHKIKKHRQRNVACDQCDDKFFSKYDLAIHQLRHSEDMPYECVACGKKFKRIILLKRHEKLVHADLAQQVCPHCPASFLSCDELEAHLKKHERLLERPHACSLCDKKFLERSTLQRHIQFVHNRDLNFRCEYCPQRFPSVTKLSRHVRTHAGERPYPCKYCDKSFMKSHHYTRHVRVKHRDEDRSRSGTDVYRCEQCEVSFTNQDELIYHSAIHATQNLTCPLCQEKFGNVDEVTAHIKSHVTGMEFMCDFCELVFTNKAKLENHVMQTHEDEIQNELGQDESSMETEDMDADAEDEDDDNSINVKEEDDHMVIEIKKAGDYLLKNSKSKDEAEEKLAENSNTEDSDTERMDGEQVAAEKVATVKKVVPTKTLPKEVLVKTLGATLTKPAIHAKPVTNEIAARKPEEVKRTPVQQSQNAFDNSIEKKEKQTMAQLTKVETGNDKSLRLLEKELQDLKRTNSRSEAVKTPPIKATETPRGRGRPPLHSSTPKIKPTEEKKPLVVTKTATLERKQLEKKVITKENKEPKVVKETRPYSKEDKDTNKNVVKNGANEKSGVEDGIRRSTRPCKIKDYAKMIRVNTQENSDSDELDDDDDEYRQSDRSMESQGRVRARRNSVRPPKGSPAPSPAAPPPAPPPTVPATPATPAGTVPPRKRGRPRKDQSSQQPPKIKRVDTEPDADAEATEETLPSDADQSSMDTNEPTAEVNQPSADANQSSAYENQRSAYTNQPRAYTNQSNADMNQPSADVNQPSANVNQPSTVSDTKQDDSQDSTGTTSEPHSHNNVAEKNKQEESAKPTSQERKSPFVDQETPQSPSKLVSPTGQTLKKIPIRSLPPGVKPLPLPLVSRNIPPGELCQMQIGKKVVKVQKIVMTKAEVEAMAKQGLVEMKDGTMVLKQGVKLPKVESIAVKPAAADGDRDPSSKRERAVPTRYNLGDE